MNTTIQNIKNWQDALSIEIGYLRKFGSRKYRLFNGFPAVTGTPSVYFFETAESITIPAGTTVKITWSGTEAEGRILSSEGKSMLVSFEKDPNRQISEAVLTHDPWELLEELISRLDECKKSKKKRIRIKRVMNPVMPAKHKDMETESTVKQLYARSLRNPVTYVWGPPGTGKSYTLARTAANHYLKGRKVLILSHSNQAVDVLMNETADFLKRKKRFKTGGLFRYGNQANIEHADITASYLLEKEAPDLYKDKEQLFLAKKGLKTDLEDSYSTRDTDSLLEVEKELAQVLEKIRKKEAGLVKKAGILGTTLAKAATDSSIYGQDYDLVIVDEASMAYVPQAAFAASLGERVIICGDFMQLAPIAASRHPLVDEWLKEDIFHKSGTAKAVTGTALPPHLLLLKEQRRMHPEISSFTNRYIYHGLVGDHPDAAASREKIREMEPFAGRSSILADTSGFGTRSRKEAGSSSRINIWQLLLSFQAIREAYEGGSRSIGYMAPYKAQCALMKVLLEDWYGPDLAAGSIFSATVHRFQGSERDVMIFDTVDSIGSARPGMLLTGKGSDRLINVAVSRARGKFIQVSNAAYIRKTVRTSGILRKLTDHQIQNGHQIGKAEIGKWIHTQHNRLRWIHARKLDQVFKDIQRAEKEVHVALPPGSGLPDEWKARLNARGKGVSLTVSGGGPLTGLDIDNKKETGDDFPLIIIDRQILWLGQPLFTSLAEPPYISARLHSDVFLKEWMARTGEDFSY